jgi:uncharacterized protein (UPF0548 family)
MHGGGEHRDNVPPARRSHAGPALGYGGWMPGGLPLSRRLATAARWPVGICLTSWRYMWRTTPMHRREVRGSPSVDSPPPLPSGLDTSEIQGPADGAGPLFHRRYGVRIRDAELSPEELMDRFTRDPNAFAPSEFASFHKRRGNEGRLRVGDEYVVRMPGPWDGPVRVVERTPTSFRLATLAGHLEAGQIQFRAGGDGPLAFTIESWARSADRLSDFLYQHLRMAKEIQLHMWTSVLERAVEASGGRRAGRLDIETRRLDAPTGGADRLIDDPKKRRALAELRHAGLNFDPAQSEQFTPERGWHLDDRSEPLPAEPPGPPLPSGSWEIARRLMRGYKFADPSIVRAFYDPDAPLEGRDMLLELRFLGLRFPAGVRVGRVYDETREVAGRELRVWGWSYRTLEGHLEQGEMHWEVRKWLDSGEVEFRIHAHSRRAEIDNPLVRMGFRLFGRREQLHFIRGTCERMRRFVEEATREGPRGEAVRRVAAEVTARRGSGTSAAHHELARNVELDVEGDS